MADSSAARFEQARGLVGSGGVMQSSFTSIPPSTSAAAPLSFASTAPPAPPASVATPPVSSPLPAANPFAGPALTPDPFALPTMAGQVSPYDFNPSSLSSYSTPQLPMLPPPLPPPPSSSSALRPPGWSKSKRVVVALLSFGILVLFVYWWTRSSGASSSGAGSPAGSPSTLPSAPQPLEATVHLDAKSPIEIRSSELTASTEAIKTQLHALNDAIVDLQAGQQLIEDTLGVATHKKPPSQSPPAKPPGAPPGKADGSKSATGPAPYSYGSSMNFAQF